MCQKTKYDPKEQTKDPLNRNPFQVEINGLRSVAKLKLYPNLSSDENQKKT